MIAVTVINLRPHALDRAGHDRGAQIFAREGPALIGAARAPLRERVVEIDEHHDAGFGGDAGAGVWASQTPWPDITVAAIVAALGISAAVRVIRQALGEIRGAHALHAAPAE
jgi:hypothetical protein